MTIDVGNGCLSEAKGGGPNALITQTMISKELILTATPSNQDQSARGPQYHGEIGYSLPYSQRKLETETQMKPCLQTIQQLSDLSVAAIQVVRFGK